MSILAPTVKNTPKAMGFQLLGVIAGMVFTNCFTRPLIFHTMQVC